jgi:hypothetical protein
MPFQTVKLLPGVRVEQTPLLLAAGIVDSNLIRFREGLPEKIGGWKRYYPNIVNGVICELWPYEDLDAQEHVGVGMVNGPVNVLTNGNLLPTQGAGVRTDVIVTIADNNAVCQGNKCAIFIHKATYVNATPPFTTGAGVQQGGMVYLQTNHFISGFSQITANTPTLGGQPGFWQTVAGSDTQLRLHGYYGVFNEFGFAYFDPGHPFFFGSTEIVPPGSPAPTWPPPAMPLAYQKTYIPCVSYSYDWGTTTNNIRVHAPYPPVGKNWTEELSVPFGPYTIHGFYKTSENQGGNTNGWQDPNGAIGFGAVMPATFDIQAGVDLTSVSGGNPFLIPTVSEYQPPSAPPPSQTVGSYSYFGSALVWTPAYAHVSGGVGTTTGQDWTMLNFGSDLLACPLNGPILRWTPDHLGTTNGTVMPCPNSPSINRGIFLAMPQQQIVAYGSSTEGVQDPMLVSWSDSGDFTTWQADVKNQAGTYRLSRGSLIVGGIQAPQQAMLWTDLGLWLMTYVGYPDVWGFAEIAQGCGLISQKAVIASGPQVFWMSHKDFWTYTNNVAQPLPCSLWDLVFQDLNYNYAQNFRAGSHTSFSEIFFFFTRRSTGATYNDYYVKFNRMTGEWDHGELNIGDWTDNSICGGSMSAMIQPGGTTSLIMEHELGYDADTDPIHWWFKTGMFQLAEGQEYIFVDRMRPDFVWRRGGASQPVTSQVQITLYTYQEPDSQLEPGASYGPFTVTNTSGPIDPRARGRYFAMRIEGEDLGSFTRLGAVKFRFGPDGRSG